MHKLTLLIEKREEKEKKELLSEISKILKSKKAKVKKEKDIKEYKFAAPIKNKEHGVLLEIPFEADVSEIKSIRKKLEGDSRILRFLIEKERIASLKETRRAKEKISRKKKGTKKEIKDGAEEVLKEIDEEKSRISALDDKLDEILKE